MTEQRQIFTIGHSNQPIDRFFDLLQQHHIEAVVDVRRFPSSRTFPHFNRTQLEIALRENGIEYRWLEALGGHRKKQKDGPPSPNLGIRDQALRDYADHMLTSEFRAAIEQLLNVAQDQRTAIMCAEAASRRCHRRLLSDHLKANSVSVHHISPHGETTLHELSECAKTDGGVVTYPESLPLFDSDQSQNGHA